MKMIFSLFGRPRELSYCLSTLKRCRRAKEFEIHFDINDAANPVNTDVVRQVEDFAGRSGLKCIVDKLPDGHGPDRNILRSLRKFKETVIYCAGDVIFHEDCLAKYLELHEKYPDNPCSLYHAYSHPLHHEKNHTIAGIFAFESYF